MIMTLSKQQQPDLSIVIPAYQEQKRIGRSLDELSAFLNNNVFFKDKNVEILVVAADTTDKTHKIVMSKISQFKQLELIKPGPKVGKGRDVQYGILRASGKMIIFMDADLATPLSHLKEFYIMCEQGNDIVIGTRNLHQYRSNPIRRTFSIIGNVLFRIGGGLWIEDSQCSFKLFNEQSAKLCFSKLKIMGWGFDMEVLAIAKANGLKIQACRIDDWKDMPYSTFTEGVIITSLRSISDLVRIVTNRLNGEYLDGQS